MMYTKKKIRLTERVSVSFVYVSAAFTIAVLFLILGYIIFNGLFYSNRHEYGVLSYGEDRLGAVAVAVNRDTGTRELSFDVVRDIFSDEYPNWKKISGKTYEVYPYIAETAEAAARDALFPAGAGSPGALVEYPADTAAALTAAASRPGGVAIVPAGEYEAALDTVPGIRKKIRRVTVRDIAVVCNPEVTALHGNFRIGSIDESDIRKLFDGQIVTWKELGGVDMPVVLVVPPENTSDGVPSLYDTARKAGYSYAAAVEHSRKNGYPRIIETQSMAGFYDTLRGTEGAFSLAPASMVPVEHLSSIRLARSERGINLKPSFIFQKPVDSGKFGGISSIILNTFIMILLTLLFAVPPGLFAAIYLVEYAKDGRLMRILRLGTETLAGIPSIIFGLFGMLIFVQAFGWGICLLSGCLTLTLMILPTIVRTAEEALKSVSPSLKEGSYALGATKIQTIFRVVLPAAFPAISSGIILATGRALGETAALIYTMGSNYNLTAGLFDSTRTLAVHLYLIIAEGISTDRAFASATVLIVFILIINTASRRLISHVGRMSR